MKDTSTVNAGFKNFQRAYNEALPNTLHASRALQGVVGVEPGMKMIGSTPVKLWKLPKPPNESVEEIVEIWKKDMAKMMGGVASTKHVVEQDDVEGDDDDEEDEVSSQDTDEVLWHGDDDEEGSGSDYAVLDDDDESGSESESEIKKRDIRAPTCYSLPEDGTAMPAPTVAKRKLASSPIDELQPERFNNSKKPKIVIDLTDSCTTIPTPAADGNARRLSFEILPRRASSNIVPTQRPTLHVNTNLTAPAKPVEVPLDAIKAVENAASPPPNWILRPHPDPRGTEPCYWSPLLSKHINLWFRQPETKSSQTYLEQLQLGSLPGSDGRRATVHISVDLKDYGKVKASRIKLPPSVRPVEMQDWIVFEVMYKGTAQPKKRRRHSSSEDMSYRKPKQTMPSYAGVVPAFWLLAFPVQAVMNSSTQRVALPVSPTLPRPQKKGGGMKATDQYVTTLLLGKAGRAPLALGRGVDEKFADVFVQAFARGKAVIEMRSSEAVRL